MANFVAIIGAGLTGLMAALHLAQKKQRLIIFEKRSHEEICAHRTQDQPGRSMSMDISARGAFALQNVEIFDKVLARSVAMKNRITHDKDGKQFILPYGQYEHEEILTISRSHLFSTLLAKCETFSNITINFNHRLDSIDFCRRTIQLTNHHSSRQITLHPDLVIGTDGVNSSVRKIMEAHNSSKFHVSFFPMSYKELTIPESSAKDFAINAMHIWPRENAMVVAQPNFNNSFTCALFLYEKSIYPSFDTIDSGQKVRHLFDEQFLDVSERMPNLETEFAKNPIGQVKIVMGSSWSHDDFALVLGDAAHGMTPFFGQGVNCCFEDCTFLQQSIEQFGDDWPSIIRHIDEKRVKEANAINTLSYDNYPELLDGKKIPYLYLTKQCEAMLSRQFRSLYRTYHNLVCFDRVPYTLAQQVKEIQTDLLARLCTGIKSVEQIDSSIIEKEMSNYLVKLALTEKNHDPT